MKKKKNPLFLALGVLVVLGVCQIGIEKGKEAQQKKEEENKEYVLTMENVTALSYQSDGTVLSFEKNGDTWSYAEDAEFPLNELKITNIETDALEIEPVRVLEDADAWSEYGLEEPEKWVQLTDANGESKKILIGNETDSNYYISIEGENTVYTTASGLADDLYGDLYDLIQLEDFPYVSSADIVSVEVAKADGSGYTLDKKEKEVELEAETEEESEAEETKNIESMAEAILAEGTAQENEESEKEESGEGEISEGISEEVSEEESIEETITEEDIVEWYVTDAQSGQTYLLAETDTADSIAQTLSSLYVSSCENYKVSEEELALYGLDQPTVISYVYEDEDSENTEGELTEVENSDGSETQANKVSFEVGNLDDSQTYYYVRLENSKAVNKIMASSLDTLLAKTSEDFH
ncbi:MAG: DUF4340 domain-containing protein [bacterium]|nr:DUF4340 domain-containing protein [bacterium]